MTHEKKGHKSAPPVADSRRSCKWLMAMLAALCCMACHEPEVSPYTLPVWEQAADFPDGARASATVAVSRQKAYLFFGRRTTKGQFMHDCWEYDPQHDTWTQKTSCPGYGRVKAVSVTANEKIYTGLGYTDTTYISAESLLYEDTLYLKDFWCYDPQLDTWTELARAPFDGTNACVAFALKNEICVGLGYHGGAFGKEWWKYSPTENRWSKMNDFDGLSRFGALAGTHEERTFVGTGFRADNLNDWWEYLPETDTWVERSSMPDNGRVNGVALSVEGRMFVTAGRYFKGSLTGGHLKAELMEYDMEHDKWYTAGTMPHGGRENAVAFTIGKKGYVGLGENDHTLLADMMCFTVEGK